MRLSAPCSGTSRHTGTITDRHSRRLLNLVLVAFSARARAYLRRPPSIATLCALGAFSDQAGSPCGIGATAMGRIIQSQGVS